MNFIELMPKRVFTATAGLVLTGGILLAGPGLAAADDNKDSDNPEQGCVALTSDDSADVYTDDDKKAAKELNGKLSDDMAGNMEGHNASCARMVVETAKDRGLDKRAAEIAMSTVIVETHLDNLTGGDRDSIGLYQQRDHYGSAEDRVDPAWTTNAFFDELENVYPNESWADAPIGDVAQDVQRSAYPDRYGYQADDAKVIVDYFW